jgi:hypothetical protein
MGGSMSFYFLKWIPIVESATLKKFWWSLKMLRNFWVFYWLLLRNWKEEMGWDAKTERESLRGKEGERDNKKWEREGGNGERKKGREREREKKDKGRTEKKREMKRESVREREKREEKRRLDEKRVKEREIERAKEREREWERRRGGLWKCKIKWLQSKYFYWGGMVSVNFTWEFQDRLKFHFLLNSRLLSQFYLFFAKNGKNIHLHWEK